MHSILVTGTSLSPSPGTTIRPVNKPQLLNVISPPATPHFNDAPATIFSGQAWFPRQKPSLIGKLTRPTGQKPKSYLRQRSRPSALLHLIDRLSFFSLASLFFSFSTPPLLLSNFSNNTLPSSFDQSKKRPRQSSPLCASLAALLSLSLQLKERRALVCAASYSTKKSLPPTPGILAKWLQNSPVRRTLLSLFPSPAYSSRRNNSLFCAAFHQQHCDIRMIEEPSQLTGLPT